MFDMQWIFRRSPARAALGLIVAAAMSGCALPTPPRGGATPATVQRLYVLYCGEAQIPDVSPWSPGFNAGKPAVFSDNCYLIRHGEDWLLWETGYADALAAMPEGIVGPRSRALRTRTLAAQLAEIGVAPAQVTHLAFSHAHPDHAGNVGLFPAATLLIQQAEYDAVFGNEPQKYGFAPATAAALRSNPTAKLQGDHDVFGDGSVTILSTPGHTPGHQSLLVRLPKRGAVVLSGDVAHFEENYVNRRVPGFNFDVQQSKASMDKVARVVEAEKAQLWINHDAAQTAGIVHAPGFIE